MTRIRSLIVGAVLLAGLPRHDAQAQFTQYCFATPGACFTMDFTLTPIVGSSVYATLLSFGVQNQWTGTDQLGAFAITAFHLFRFNGSPLTPETWVLDIAASPLYLDAKLLGGATQGPFNIPDHSVNQDPSLTSHSWYWNVGRGIIGCSDDGSSPPLPPDYFIAWRTCTTSRPAARVMFQLPMGLNQGGIPGSPGEVDLSDFNFGVSTTAGSCTFFGANSGQGPEEGATDCFSLATTTPEPATLSLVAIGLAAGGLAARRRRRRFTHAPGA